MATKLNRLQNALDALKRVKTGAQQAFGEGREDHRQAARRARKGRNQAIEGTKIGQMMSSNRTATLIRELLGQAKPGDIKARQDMGLGLSDDRATRIGQILGTIGGDIVQDRGRELWWLVNAPQALANIAQEVALKRMAPDLYGAAPVLDAKGNPVRTRKTARVMDLVDSEGHTKAGVSKEGDTYMQRNYEPGYVDALAIPTGIAVNAGIGLLNPFGGQEGYKAVFESEEDPSKTSNVIGEVAAKYILGRTGGLLPWDEFKKVRPDVSKDEYMRYKAFKFDNETDLNPLDGDIVLPTGVLKYTDEGIHGPEVQFLGRSLPVSTAILPAAASVLGTAYGARRGAPTGRAIRGGLIGGMGSLAASSLIGNAIEGERRRRNQQENEQQY
jgi:hypothetical protein